MATNTGTFIRDPLQLDRLKSALFFVKSVQEQIEAPENEDSDITIPTIGNGIKPVPGHNLSNTTALHARTSTSANKKILSSSLLSSPSSPSSSSSLSTIRGPIAPVNVLVDVQHRLSLRNADLGAATSTSHPKRTGSPRSSTCPYEWDGVPGVSAAKIYRLNPSPGQQEKP